MNARVASTKPEFIATWISRWVRYEACVADVVVAPSDVGIVRAARAGEDSRSCEGDETAEAEGS